MKIIIINKMKGIINNNILLYVWSVQRVSDAT